MSERYNEFKALGADVIAVSRDPLDKATDFLLRREVPFTCLMDHDRSMFDVFGVPSTVISLGQRPATFVIDSQGGVAYADVGRQQWDIPTVESLLEVCRNLNGQAETH